MGKRRSKTVAYKYLESVCKLEIIKRRKDIQSFLKSFKPPNKAIKVIVYNELKDLVIEKNPDKDRINRISLTSLDVDNSLKAVIDSTFKQIGINDAEIIGVEGWKFPSLNKENNIYLEIVVIDREEAWQKIRESITAM